MSHSTCQIEKWTEEEVQHWLMTQVKINQTHADRLLEEEVLGDYLITFEKKDILELGIKHGPAVKILFYLESLKQGSKYEPQLPAYVEKWTKEQVNQWLLQHVKVYSKYAELLQEEDVSGDCLACFRKQDFLDLGVKSGPAVKILAELCKLKSKPEPMLLSPLPSSAEQPRPQPRLPQDQLKLQCHSKEVFNRKADQGDKLKNLLTCGGNTLDNYNRFVVIVNKSSPGQVEDLQFLNKLKLFCVLDFDPDSAAQGRLCHSYRESQVANLHTPSQYQGQTDAVIKELNLYKQTSWVFCNGRHDIDSESNRELDYKNWLKRACRDVEQLVSFVSRPEVLLHGQTLIIFLLLSPVHSEKDPIFDTYKAFFKHTEEKSIIHICESQSTYENWRNLIQEKCECDIIQQSVYELTLCEVNGTIMALGPFNQASKKLLPSSDSSSVVLKQKDEEFMTALDVLCLNQCENIYEENRFP